MGLRGEFAGLRNEFAGLRGEFEGLRNDFAGLRSDFAAHRAQTKDDMAVAISNLRFEFQASNSDLRTHLSEQINRQTWRLMVSLPVVGSVIAALFKAVS